MKKRFCGVPLCAPCPCLTAFPFFFPHSTQPCASVSHVLRKTIVVTVFFPVFLDTKYFLLILVARAHLSHCFITFFLLCPLLLCKEKQSLVTCSLRPKCVVYIYIHICLCVCRIWLETIEMSACLGMLTAVSFVWCE